MPQGNQTNNGLWLALGFAWRLGYSIAVPLVVLLLVGRFLDKHYNTSPLLLISGLVLSFATTNVLMFREAFRVMKQANEENNAAKPGSSRDKRDTSTNIKKS